MPGNDEAAARLMQDVLAPGAPMSNPTPQVEAEASPAEHTAAVTKELIGSLLAQLPPEKLVEMLKSVG